jgi:SAM-dependent methyltransferase
VELRFQVEDHGAFRRLYSKGPHTHDSGRGASTCEECEVDLPFSVKFIEQLIDWDSRGIFHFIGERLCNDTFNEGPRRTVYRFCPDLTGRVVLDFGSGLGQLSPFFLERGARQVILAEIDTKLLELSKTYLADMGHAKKCRYFLIREGDELAFIENESIDLIVASEVFEHILPHYRKTTLRTLYSKLKPGGIIVITAPNRMFPKDGHTTGLWFTAWLPAAIGAWYARTFASWRWKGRSTEDLLRQGLRQYSYFEAKKALTPLGARDLCSEFTSKDRGSAPGRSSKTRVFYRVLSLSFSVVLRHFGPWEAWQTSLEIAWSKPPIQDRPRENAAM